MKNFPTTVERRAQRLRERGKEGEDVNGAILTPLFPSPTFAFHWVNFHPLLVDEGLWSGKVELIAAFLTSIHCSRQGDKGKVTLTDMMLKKKTDRVSVDNFPQKYCKLIS